MILPPSSHLIPQSAKKNCKDCKHFDSGHCKAFKFIHYLSGKEEIYFPSAKQSRASSYLCGPFAGLFSKK
jgi:hypothetical protein